VIRTFLAELKRRRVLRVAGVYTVVAWAILEGADRIFPILTLPPWTVSFVAVLLLILLPIVMIVTWAFELTPEGIRRTTTPDGAPPAFAWAEWVLLLAIVVVIALSVMQFVGREAPPAATSDEALVTTEPAAAIPVPPLSVAVLPFTSFSTDPESNYFADGLTEELINVLAQGGALKVAGRTSSFYFKDRNEDLRDVGRKLGVAYVLEGSVRRGGDRLRITAQLVSTADGFHLWSQTYDRRPDDVLAIQDDVATSVAAVLEAKLVPTGAREHEAEHHRQFLVAIGSLRARNLESLTQARTLFEDLMRREPDNPAVYAGYARATSLLAGAYLTLDFEPAVVAARAAVARALELDPDSIAALIAAADLNSMIAHRSDERRLLAVAESHLARAAVLAPDDPEVLTAYGSLLNEMEEHQRARELLGRALGRDPLSPTANFQMVVALQGQGRLIEAKARLEQLIEMYPDAMGVRLELAELLVAQGQFEAALPVLRRVHASRSTPRGSFALANLYLNLGLLDDVNRTLDELDYAPIAASFVELARRNVAGDDAGALALARAQLAANNDPIWRAVIVVSALIVNDLAAARAEIELLDGQLLGETADAGRAEPNLVLYAANLLRREQRPSAAGRLLESLLHRYAPAEAGYDATSHKLIRAAALAELDRRDEAIAELRAAYLQGFRTIWDFDQFHRLDRLPTFARLADDDRFRAIVADIEADNARARARILASKADGG
jgi:TolB-like protein/Tfp pilus assembly protein PilF